RDAIDQITQILGDRTNIDSIHIVSHGAPGSLQLGDVRFSLEDIECDRHSLQQWFSRRTDSICKNRPNILLYGCCVAAGETGKAFVKRLSELTGACVAASQNLTGSVAKGGDWELEVSTGSIETPLVFEAEVLAGYEYVLSTFGLATNFPITTDLREVATADFNKDGNLDLAFGSNGPNSVSIALGDGTGKFGSASYFNTNPPTALYTVSVAVGDFNKDGNSDLVTANNATNNVSLLLGNGDGTFGAATYFGVGSNPGTVIVADFNGDGNSDLATANLTSNNVSILLGNGNGTFSAATTLSQGKTTTFWVVVADFNKDGKSDLATANYGSNSVSILLQNANGTLGAATNFTVGNNPYYIAIGDFNGDNNPDLAISNQNSNNVSILLGTGTGNFSAATNFSVGTQPQNIATGDFNADGKVDLATANYGSGDVSVLFGSGNGSFGTATNFVVGTNPRGIVVGDFNKDGLSDLATENYGSANSSILLNTLPAVNFGAATYSATEGTADTVVNIPVTLTGTPDAALTVPIVIDKSSTATPNSDYTISPTSITFPAGATGATLTQNIAVTIKPDNIAENAETAILNLGTIIGGIAGTTKKTTLTIAANGTVSYAIAAGTASIAEGNSGTKPLTFTATRSGNTGGASSVNYTIDGTATNVSDYNNIGGTSGATAATGTINFGADETSQTITVDVLGDPLVEPDETIAVTLSNPTGPGLTPTITTATATTTITNDDVAPPTPTPTPTTPTPTPTPTTPTPTPTPTTPTPTPTPTTPTPTPTPTTPTPTPTPTTPTPTPTPITPTPTPTPTTGTPTPTPTTGTPTPTPTPTPPTPPTPGDTIDTKNWCGVEAGLDKLEKILDDKLQAVNLPIVGSLKNISPDFIGNFKTKLVDTIKNLGNQSLSQLETSLRTALGSDFNVAITGNSSAAESTLLITLGRQYEFPDINLSKNLGVPALSLDVDGKAKSKYNYNLSLGVGVSKEFGCYIDTDKTKLTANIDLGLDDQFKAKGNLGFFQVDLANDTKNLTKVDANLEIKFNDLDNLGGPNDGDRLTLPELQGSYQFKDLFKANLTSTANLGLTAKTSINGNAAFPSYNFDLAVNWPILNYANGQLTGPQKPTVAFNNMQLDLGTFVNNFAKPIIGKISDVIKPFRPVINFLNADTKLLSKLGLAGPFDKNGDGKVSVLELAAKISGRDIDTRFLSAVAKVDKVVDLANQIANSPDKIDFGSYTLGNIDVAAQSANLQNASPVPKTAVQQTANQQINSKTSGKVKEFLNALQDIDGFDLPLLTKPETAIQLLIGKPDVSVFTYQMPKLGFDFKIDQKFPIWGPIKGLLEGKFSAEAHLGFGYDTYGLNQWKNSNFAAGSADKVLDGFYVSDRENADGTGRDVDELTLDASIAVGAGIDVKIAEAYVKGGIQGKVGIDLIDIGEFQPKQGGDGKIRTSEITSRISKPLELFDVTGQVNAFLGAEVKVISVKFCEKTFKIF
ncbi:FG-GAP-like repeat-containing protein, partial [Microcoleus sp. OTE_8_concoct_300]|uniref:FG-GAP-like repeat-containing protein n=1 Tax=Microcoleus sp. OTE_8_concoct_300 TaxID=2964710 RepID=UPI00403EFFD8